MVPLTPSAVEGSFQPEPREYPMLPVLVVDQFLPFDTFRRPYLHNAAFPFVGGGVGPAFDRRIQDDRPPKHSSGKPSHFLVLFLGWWSRGLALKPCGDGRTAQYRRRISGGRPPSAPRRSRCDMSSLGATPASTNPVSQP